MSEPEISKSIKWRESTYLLVEVRDGRVFWKNPVSRHEASCSVEAWKNADPYDHASK